VVVGLLEAFARHRLQALPLVVLEVVAECSYREQESIGRPEAPFVAVFVPDLLRKSLQFCRVVV
jgi:hypothetical protein